MAPTMRALLGLAANIISTTKHHTHTTTTTTTTAAAAATTTTTTTTTTTCECILGLAAYYVMLRSALLHYIISIETNPLFYKVIPYSV